MATLVKTIGTASRDYSTIGLWEADLDDGTAAANDPTAYQAGDVARGEMYADSDLAAVTLNGGTTIGLARVELVAASGEGHLGVAASGAGEHVRSTGRFVCAGNTSFEYLIEQIESIPGTNNNDSIFDCGSGGIVRVNRILGHGWVTNNSGTQQGFMKRGDTGSAGTDAMPWWSNNIVYDIEQNGGGSRVLRGIRFASNRYNRAVNCTVDNLTTNASGARNCYMAQDDGNLHYFRNCWGSGGSAAWGFTSGQIDIDYCAADDTSPEGANSLTSLTAADQFVSLTGGSENYHLKSGADLIDEGADLGDTPANIAIDIDGRNRDTEGDVWDIGADEFVAAGGTDDLDPYMIPGGAQQPRFARPNVIGY